MSKDNEMRIGAGKKISPSPSPPAAIVLFPFLHGKYSQNEALGLELLGSENVGRCTQRDWAMPFAYAPPTNPSLGNQFGGGVVNTF